MTCLAPHLALQKEEAVEESIAIEITLGVPHVQARYEGGTEAREYREKDGEEDEASGEEKEASGEEKEASGEEASDSDKD